MKNFLLGLLCTIVVALCVVMCFMFNKIKELEKNNQTEISQLENNNEIDSIDNTSKEITYRKVAFDENKVKNAAQDVIYEENGENYISSTEFGVAVIQKGQKLFVSTHGFTEKYNWHDGISGIKDVENKEITGFQGELVTYFLAAQGQDVTPPKILFLMSDGTVEYIDSFEMLKNNDFTSKGKIEGLTNINRFTFVNVRDVMGGGVYSTVAIDNDGYSYDIFKMNLD